MILKNDLEITVKSILAFNKSNFTTYIPTYLPITVFWCHLFKEENPKNNIRSE